MSDISDAIKAAMELQVTQMTAAMNAIVKANTQVFTDYQAQFKRIIEANAETLQKVYGSAGDQVLTSLKQETETMVAQLKAQIKDIGAVT